MEILKFFADAHPIFIYLAAFAGFFFEAEIVFVLGAFLVAAGDLTWPIFLPVAFVSIMLSDLLWYRLGARSKETRFGKWMMRKFEKYDKWLEGNFMKRYARITFVSRYIYYVGRITPFLAGWHAMPMKRFLRIHIVANFVWMIVMGVISHSLILVISLVGVRRVLRRIEYVLAGIAIAFLGGEYALEKLFLKKLKNGNGSPKEATRNSEKVLEQS